jgi:uncharacterized protein YbaR (Trm112 family)
MRYKLVDILACPQCKSFPLVLNSKKEERFPGSSEFIKKRHNKNSFECSIFCSLKNKSIKAMKSQHVGTEICRDCIYINIISGSLSCTRCKAEYVVEDSIPRMIPKRFFKTHI